MIALAFKFLGEKFTKYLMLSIIGIVAIFSIRRNGIMSERNNNLQVNADATEKRNNIRNDITSQSDGSVQRELHKEWRRD